MFILGINAYHGDSSACLVKDGRLVSAAEEERFRRIKHWAGFPSQAIGYCMEQAGIGLADIDHIAINSDPKANLWKKIKFTLGKSPDLGMVMDRIRNAKERMSVQGELERCFPGQHLAAQVHHVEHHLAHLASCFLVGPFKEAVSVSVDGFGDFASSAWGLGSGKTLDVDNRVYFPHSLGIFYQAITQFIGFPHYGDEYKVMGLAPYGKPTYLDAMRKILLLKDDGSFRLNLEYFRHHNEKIEYEWENGVPHVGTLYSPALDSLLGPLPGKEEQVSQIHKDIAHSAQAMYEEAFFHLLNTLHSKYRVDNLGLAGGCAMNSVANGKVYRKTPFKHLYIQAAAGDAGGAIGAAYVIHYQHGDKPREFVMDHAYWGPESTNDDISKLLHEQSEQLNAADCDIEYIDDERALCDRTVTAITNGMVVGWFQGRMEWGPRALGNRSIICDPRRTDIKDILNLKIKRRESFRPFAPSILREAVSEWFEEDDDVPFMMEVFQIRKDKRALIPAVTHVDGSGRLQTVHESSNPRYYQLIKSFERATGVPIVLNTSFNENEPVVCYPREALDCFLRTRMDVLVLGNWFVSRRAQ